MELAPKEYLQWLEYTPAGIVLYNIETYNFIIYYRAYHNTKVWLASESGAYNGVEKVF